MSNIDYNSEKLATHRSNMELGSVREVIVQDSILYTLSTVYMFCASYRFVQSVECVIQSVGISRCNNPIFYDHVEGIVLRPK